MSTHINPRGEEVSIPLLNLINDTVTGKLNGILGRSNFGDTTTNLRQEPWLWFR